MKNRIPLIVAVVLGIVVVFAIRRYVTGIQERADSQLQGRPVVAAAVDIVPGTVITEQMLKEISIPPRYIPRQALTSLEEKRQVVGRTVRVAVPANTPLLWSDLEVEKRGGLSSLIPEGERAFTVDISAGVDSKLLQLNDRVDILGIFQQPPEVGMAVGAAGAAGYAGIDETVCVVLLQNVNILALGETIGEIYAQDIEGLGGGAVSFSVTLQEAQLLMYAAEHGDLAMALRREGEIEVFDRADLPRITMAELEEVTRRLDDQRQSRTIEVMRGREVQTIEVEQGGGTDLGTFD
jgi:pilus assembly protein CpaB